jgi:hypothetical protein
MQTIQMAMPIKLEKIVLLYHPIIQIRKQLPYGKLRVTIEAQGIHGRVVRTTPEGGITWTQQNENNAERGESIHSQTNIF